MNNSAMKPGDIFAIIKYFGFSFLFKSAFYRLNKRMPFFKHSFIVRPWSEIELSDLVSENIDLENLREKIDHTRFFPLAEPSIFKEKLERIIDISKTINNADEVIKGNIRYFGNVTMPLSRPFDWHLNPFNKTRWPGDILWCDLDTFVEGRRDIKSVWELSRFSFGYDLARAYLTTGQDKYAQAFWEFFEEWLNNNMPNMGVNFQCGQECAIRVMSWCFALFVFLKAQATTNERLNKMLKAVWIHADRIEKCISDAIRQKTNHAMSEATGLYTVGTLFPFLKKADQWRRAGKQVLEQEGLKQIYEDGAYLQQSMNYHRLMLQIYLWSVGLGQINKDDFSNKLKERLSKATDFLYQMQDEYTGRVPNYGANDGTLILPLNNCDYLDYRPIVQAMNFLLHQNKTYEKGPWDEDLFWLFGPEVVEISVSNKTRKTTEFPSGGYYTLRGKNSWLMIRCHTYCDRVGHVDPLHLDLWADGINLLRDCGSYRYYVPDEPEYELYFKSIWAHNTVIVEDESPLKLISRFIFLPWPKAKLDEFDVQLKQVKWAGTHYAYDKSHWNVKHYREVLLTDGDCWQICDQLMGNGKHKLELRWHLPNQSVIDNRDLQQVTVNLVADWKLSIKANTKIDAKLLCGDICGGWESLYYSQKTAINTLSIVTNTQLPTEFVTGIYKEN